jgi:hypothetical protein
MSIFRVTFEQFFTEPEEAGIGQAIVFENDRAFGLTENPIQPGGNIAP